MTTVYILRGSKGRHYIGRSDDFASRLKKHQGGHVHSTCRLGLPLTVVVCRDYATRAEAMGVERKLKAFKSPEVAIAYLR